MLKYGNLYDHKLPNILFTENNKNTSHSIFLYKNKLYFFTFLNNNI